MPSTDSSLTSFIDVPSTSHFSIRNLPYGAFSTARDPQPRIGVAIGDVVLDLAVLEAAGLLGAGAPVFAQPALNAFLARGPQAWSATRSRLHELLDARRPELRDDGALLARALVPQAQATMRLPVAVPAYTDFFSSREHARNTGRIFRGGDDSLAPNWLELPVAYNGRASSVVVSGSPVARPYGQMKIPGSDRPVFGPCRALDFELEMAFVVGVGNALGRPIPVAEAERHIFGLVLLNDWSARDIQVWESTPLGPFNGKSFATSISPWVVPLAALEPFRVPGPLQEPDPLPYLRSPGDGAFDIALDVRLRTGRAEAETTLCRSNARYLYWNVAQQLAHHTVGGCNTTPGDLMGSGTISGPTPDSRGCLLEITSNGRDAVTLADGRSRRFLEDGDEVVIGGCCEGPGYRVGFGEVRGQIVPAEPFPAGQ